MAPRSRQQRSLASLAKSLDTRKRALPADAKAGKVALRPGAVEQLKRELKAKSGSGLRAPGSGDAGRATRTSSTTGSSRSSSSTSARGTSPSATRTASAPLQRTSTSTRPPRSSPVPPVPRQRPAPRGSAPRVWSSPASARTASTSRSPESNARSPSAKPTSVGRTSALASMAKKPSPKPEVVPQVGLPVGDARRRYPRADLQVRARLLLDGDESRSFEATLSTTNISVGGMFLASTFFLKLGTPLLVELTLPNSERVVRVRGEVVRVETQQGSTGFALRFTEYLDGSEVVLATHFLSPVLREFITEYARQHRFDANSEYIAHTADVLAAWELRKAELGADVWSLVP